MTPIRQKVTLTTLARAVAIRITRRQIGPAGMLTRRAVELIVGGTGQRRGEHTGRVPRAGDVHPSTKPDTGCTRRLAHRDSPSINTTNHHQQREKPCHQERTCRIVHHPGDRTVVELLSPLPAYAVPHCC